MNTSRPRENNYFSFFSVHMLWIKQIKDLNKLCPTMSKAVRTTKPEKAESLPVKFSYSLIYSLNKTRKPSPKMASLIELTDQIRRR